MTEQTISIPEIQLIYQIKSPMSTRPKIVTSEDAHLVFRKILDPNVINVKEEAVAIFLNKSNRLICSYKLSSGGITATVVDIRLVLAIALKCLACNLIIAHTHPSGEVKPSKADEELTVKLKDASKLMDISLLDHLIISSESYLSFADCGFI